MHPVAKLDVTPVVLAGVDAEIPERANDNQHPETAEFGAAGSHYHCDCAPSTTSVTMR
jgi:hypothetical protein